MAAGDGTNDFQDGEGLDPQTKSAADRVGISSKNLGNAAKGLAGNKKALISLAVGGGLIGLILALVLGFAQLKMISMMSTLEKHFFKKNTYTFDQRKNIIMREYFNKYYGPQGDAAIDDSTAPIYRQALKAMHTGNFEKKLNAKYEIKIRAGANPASKLVTFKDKTTGESFDYDTAERADRVALNRHFDDVISNIFHENGWAKRTLYRYRISSRTGIEWHWLDKINKPYAKAQLYAANQVTAFLLSDRSPASAYASQIIDKLLGDEHSDAKQQYTAAAEAGATDEATKIVAKQLVSKINVAGDIVAAVSLFCGINKIFSDDLIQKLVQGKAEVEEMTAYGAWSSKADQQKSGNTNSTAVTANLSLLSSEKDKQGKTQDISSSNNWYRANGQDVKYKPNDNCAKNSELCNAKTPNQITQGGILGALNSVSDAIDSPFYQVVSATPAGAFLPGGIQAGVVCDIYDSVLKSFVNAVLGVVSDAIIGGLKLVPGGAEFLSKIGEVTASLTQSVLSLVLPPVVDASTRGPALLNILASGADLSANSMMGSPAGHAPDDGVACKDKSAEEQKQDGSYCLGTLSPSENKQLVDAATQADAEKFKRLPTYQKIASIDEPDSVLSRIVAHTPASPSVGIQQGTDTMMAVINPARWGKMLASVPTLLSGPTFAADSNGGDGFITNDRSGKATSQFTDQYGASEDTVKNAPLGDSKLGNTDDWVGCTLVASAENGDPSKMPADCPKDPNTDEQQVCADAPADGGSPGSVYILGDSITEGDYYENTGPDYLKGLLDKVNIDSTANASSGRAITIAGTDRDKTSGLKAAEGDKDKTVKGGGYKDADTIVVELGTNVDGGVDDYKKAAGKLAKYIKENAKDGAQLYWVDIFSDGVAGKSSRNTALEEATKPYGFTIIKADDKNIALGSDKIHPTPGGYKTLSDVIYKGIGGGAGAGGSGAQDLAKQILANKNVTYPYRDDPRGITVEPVMQKIADTGKAFTDSSDPSAVANRVVTVNPNILKAVLEYAKDGKIGINALTNADHSEGSNHYTGEAIDFDCSLDTGKMDKVAAKFGGKRNDETCDGNRHWHYDFLKDGKTGNDTPAPAPATNADCPTTGAAAGVTGDRATLAARVLANPLLKLGNYGNSASQKKDIQTPQPQGGLVDNTVKLMDAIMTQGKMKLPVNALRTDHHVENGGGNGDGLHNVAGAAVDIGYNAGDKEGAKLYKWIYDNRKVLNINMMIWNPPPGGYKCVGQGEPVDCLAFFGAETMAGHANHIHVGVWRTDEH